jgi:hypothetical protein
MKTFETSSGDSGECGMGMVPRDSEEVSERPSRKRLTSDLGVDSGSQDKGVNKSDTGNNSPDWWMVGGESIIESDGARDVISRKLTGFGEVNEAGKGRAGGIEVSRDASSGGRTSVADPAWESEHSNSVEGFKNEGKGVSVEGNKWEGMFSKSPLADEGAGEVDIGKVESVHSGSGTSI